MVAAMDNQPGFGTPLDQIGQGYGNPPAGLGQPFDKSSGGGQLRSFADIMRGPGDFRSRLQQFISQGQGSPAMGTLPGYGAAARPPNPPANSAFDYPASPPANSDNQFGGVNAGGTAGGPGNVAGGPPADGAPAGGSSFNYWGSQRQPPSTSAQGMGGGFNAAGFGGLGTTGGQGPGARYWARLNNIGGA